MARKDNELSFEELEFCRLRSCGSNQSDAYREAFHKTRATQKSIVESASRLSRRPQVVSMMRELFATAKKSALLSAAGHLDSVLADLQAAREDRNWTAVSSLQRIAGACIGNLSETLNIGDQRMSDDQLIDRLAGDNPEAAEMLRKIVGGRATFH